MNAPLCAALAACDEEQAIQILQRSEDKWNALFSANEHGGPSAMDTLLSTAHLGQWSEEFLEFCGEMVPMDVLDGREDVWEATLQAATKDLGHCLAIARGLVKSAPPHRFNVEKDGETLCTQLVRLLEKETNEEEAGSLLRLLPYEAFLQQSSANGDCGLFAAVSRRCGPLVLEMIPLDVDIGALELCDGMNVVHCVLSSSGEESLEAVLKRTSLAHWTAPTQRHRMTPLFRAASRFPALAKLFIDRLPDEHLNPRTSDGRTPFMMATLETKRLLLERLPMSELFVADVHGRTPLCWALICKRPTEEVLWLMNELSTEQLAAPTTSLFPAFLLACRKGILLVVQQFLERLPEEALLMTDRRHANALHVALSHRAGLDVVAALVAGLPPSARHAANLLGKSPIDMAEDLGVDYSQLLSPAVKSANG